MNNSQLDIVLPCYNPLGDWVDRLIHTHQQLSSLLPGVALRFLLVNDGSTSPPSSTEIQTLTQHIPGFLYFTYETNKGKGHALRTGVRQAESEICIYTDMDFPYQIHDVVNLYHKLLKGDGDVVVGVKSETYYEHVPWARIQISKLLQLLTRTFLRIQITDTQCGLKGFNEKGKSIFLQTTIERYLCDLEFVFLAERAPDVSVVPMSVELREHVSFGRFGWKILMVESMNFAGVFLRSFTS